MNPDPSFPTNPDLQGYPTPSPTGAFMSEPMAVESIQAVPQPVQAVPKPVITVQPRTVSMQVPQPQPAPQPTTPAKKGINIQKNWLVNYTTIALSSALLLLMLGMGGWVIYLYINASNLQSTTNNAVANESQQKLLRERLQDAYDRQSTLNDDMVTLQDRSLQATAKYQSQLLKNFRVIAGKPEAIQGQNIEDMRNSEENLYNILRDIDAQIETNAKKKEQLKQEIDTLYKQAEQEQARRLNIRDGLRQ